jgi:hypothetical protein
MPILTITNGVCSSCTKGKHVKHKVPKQNNTHVIEKNAFIQLDLCRQLPHASLRCSWYGISFSVDMNIKLGPFSKVKKVNPFKSSNLSNNQWKLQLA